jgi:hypothetical protein
MRRLWINLPGNALATSFATSFSILLANLIADHAADCRATEGRQRIADNCRTGRAANTGTDSRIALTPRHVITGGKTRNGRHQRHNRSDSLNCLHGTDSLWTMMNGDAFRVPDFTEDIV